MFADLRPAFPTGPSICLGGGREEGQQASSLSSKHKLWNFHRYRLVNLINEGGKVNYLVLTSPHE